MEIGTLFLAVLGVALVFKFMVSPFFYRRAILDRGVTGSAKHALSTFIDFTTFMLFLLSFALATSWLILQYVNSSGGSSFDELKIFLDQLKFIDTSLFSLGSQTFLLSLILLLIILSIYSYKQGEKRFDKKLKLALEKDVQRLQEDMIEDRWEDLSPTEEMLKLAELIEEYQLKVEEIKEVDTNDENIFLLKENIETMKEYMQSLDVQRRLNIEVEDEPIEPKNKILTFFMSQGLMNTLQRTSFFFFIVAIMLFIPLFVAVSSQHLNKSLKEKIVTLSFKVEELKIEKEYNKLRVVNVKNKIKITEEDEATLNELANSFENQFIRTRVLSGVKDSVRTKKTLHAYTVRESILKQNAKRSQYVMVTKGEIPPTVTEGILLEERAILSDEPVTDIGKRFKEDLRKEVLLKDHKLWEHYKSLVKNATDSFQKPLTPKDLKGLAISNLLGDLGDALEDVYRLESKRYMIALGREQYMDNVLKKMSHVNFRLLPQHLEIELDEGLKKIANNDELLKVLNENPPSLSSVPERTVKTKDINLLIHKLAQQTHTTFTNTYANALASFDDYFPGKLAMERHTPMAVAMDYVGFIKNDFSAGGGGGGSSSSSKSSHTKTKTSFRRARSYIRLKGFSRIGGVLIGRMPSGDVNELDISDIKWERVGDKLKILLIKKDKTETDLGLFNPAIVNLALAYASDGRATTVTMVTAEPLQDLKILLHPSLVDSGLGCQAIELDRIVDITTSSTENLLLNFNRRNETIKIFKLKELYEYSWAIRLQTLIQNNIELQQILLTSDYLRALDKYSKNIINNVKIDFSSIKNNINLTFGKEKIAFFDKNLIENIEICIDSKIFKNCIEKKNKFITINEIDELINPIPQKIQTTVWSGVREQKYQLDKNFNFLRLEKHDTLWPLRFMVQHVFISEPTLVSNRNEYVDEPWEYLELNKMLKSVISKNLKTDKKTKKVIDNMREFAVLQRLFRILLDDKIKTDFSLKKLIKLSSDTFKDVNTNVRTSRWNTNHIRKIHSDLYSILKEEMSKKKVSDNKSSDWVKKANECIQFLQDNNTTNEIVSIQQKNWEKNCNFTTNGEHKELDKDLTYLNFLRKLKDSLGVFIDEKYNFEHIGLECPQP